LRHIGFAFCPTPPGRRRFEGEAREQLAHVVIVPRFRARSRAIRRLQPGSRCRQQPRAA
jgi:hypothetical protein